MSKGIWLKLNPNMAKEIGSKGGKNGKRGAELWVVLTDEHSVLIKFEGINSRLYREVYHYKSYKEVKNLIYKEYKFKIPPRSGEFKTLYGSFARFNKQKRNLISSETHFKRNLL